MALLTVDQKPTISDTVLFHLPCPGADGCFAVDPYKVNSVVIYYLQVDVVNSGGDQRYDNTTYNPVFLQAYEAAKRAACHAPTDENLTALAEAQAQLEMNKTVSTSYYTEAVPVLSLGSDDNPAWLLGDQKDAFIEHLRRNAKGHRQFGHFALQWTPQGMREGDYFICWTWTPHPAGSTLTSHTPFTIYGNTEATTSIPTHRTVPGKYEFLLDKYLPQMFKEQQSVDDLTPQVLTGLNHAVADGFSMLEDMGAQIIDLLDANATPEALLKLLGNFFGLRLTSNDPTLWRRQIKEAVPNAKRRGTLKGLTAALAASGIRLAKFTHLWQVVSRFTWQEHFKVETDNQRRFVLSKRALLPANDENFEVYYRQKGSAEWEDLPLDYLEFKDKPDAEDCVKSTRGEVTVVEWHGAHHHQRVLLKPGDEVRFVYQVAEVPTSDDQEVEDYVRSLPLMDQRDERDQEHPPKNWNVRLIEQDDPWFDRVIPSRHPFADPVHFGWVRTEFAYSENVYGMEEYDGSTRQSTVPCDMDKDFVDAGHGCLSSCFSLDIEVTELSDDRILEAIEVVREYVPFHAILFSLNVTGSLKEFVPPPTEDIEVLANVESEQVVLSGNGQQVFNRLMERSDVLYGEDLAESETVVTDVSGIGYNAEVTLFSPDALIDRISDTDSLLEVLAPSANAGKYKVVRLDDRHAVVNDAYHALHEGPLDTSPFTFRLSSLEYSNAHANVFQEDVFTLRDDTLGFIDVPIIAAVDKPKRAWTVTLEGLGQFQVWDMLPGGEICILDPSHLLPKENMQTVPYVARDKHGDVMQSGTGQLTITRRARVDLASAGDAGPEPRIDDIRNLVSLGDYMLLDNAWYPVSAFVEGEPRQFYVDDYTAGDAAGQTVKVYRRVADEATGQFTYKSPMLKTVVNYEEQLNVMDGANPPAIVLESNSFRGNFIVQVGDAYYAVTDIDGDTITLGGPGQSWPTLSAGGQAVTFSIIRYTKKSFVVQEREYPPTESHEFASYDRGAAEFIVAQVEEDSSPDSSFVVSMLNTPKGNAIDTAVQQESIQVKIDWFDD